MFDSYIHTNQKHCLHTCLLAFSQHTLSHQSETKCAYSMSPLALTLLVGSKRSYWLAHDFSPSNILKHLYNQCLYSWKACVGFECCPLLSAPSSIQCSKACRVTYYTDLFKLVMFKCSVTSVHYRVFQLVISNAANYSQLWKGVVLPCIFQLFWIQWQTVVYANRWGRGQVVDGQTPLSDWSLAWHSLATGNASHRIYVQSHASGSTTNV